MIKITPNVIFLIILRYKYFFYPQFFIRFTQTPPFFPSSSQIHPFKPTPSLLPHGFISPHPSPHHGLCGHIRSDIFPCIISCNWLINKISLLFCLEEVGNFRNSFCLCFLCIFLSICSCQLVTVLQHILVFALRSPECSQHERPINTPETFCDR